MKTLLFTAIIIIVLGYLSGITIQFKPFKVSFESLYFAIGWFILIFGIGCIIYDSYDKGYKKAIKDVSTWIDEVEDKK